MGFGICNTISHLLKCMCLLTIQRSNSLPVCVKCGLIRSTARVAVRTKHYKLCGFFFFLTFTVCLRYMSRATAHVTFQDHLTSHSGCSISIGFSPSHHTPVSHPPTSWFDLQCHESHGNPWLLLIHPTSLSVSSCHPPSRLHFPALRNPESICNSSS